VTTPTPIGPASGPVYYPESNPYPTYPPLDHTADRPPVPPRKGSSAGKVIGLIVGGCLIAVTAGTIGGGVGYLIARETLPVSSTAAVAAGATAALPSTVPGSIADIAAKVQPSVVQLNVTSSSSGGTGSGFVISSDGYIITNDHVAGVAADGGTIEVVFSDGSKAPGTLVGANPGYDIAVVKVDKANLPAVTLGSSEGLQVGDAVIAVGSPLGLSGTVTTGIVSALDRPVTAGGEGSTAFIDAIQTDAAINPGNSGGPLLDGTGKVIGVNSAIASLGADASGQTGSIGLGFAIPIDTVKRIADEIVKTGTSSTPVIGVQLDMTFEGPGGKVADVTAGSPAETAGLQAGDVVTAVDGKAVADSTELIVAIRKHAPGDTVTLTVERGGQSSDIPLTLQASTS
jgi:putative serine protease PepD